MAEQLLGSPGTSLVRCGVGRVARGARSATLAVCILWLHLSRVSQSVWSMRTWEGSWRQRSVENVYHQSWLWEQHHRHDRWNEADGRRLWAKSFSLSAYIKTLENTLAAPPQGRPFESTRVYLQKEISEKKREITESKPLAMRLASCKGPVDRAAAKRVACQDAVERAIREFQQAQQRERELGEELASLERQLSEQVSMDKSNAAMTGGNSLDSPQMCMGSVLQEMATSSAVQPNMVDEARRHMEQLFMSLAALSQQSQTANHGSRPSVLQMLQCDQVPILVSGERCPNGQDATGTNPV